MLSGVGGTFSVVAANSWMNTPGGITVRDGKVVDVDVWQVFFNDAFWYEAMHMLLAAYVVAGFTVAGVYAVGMLRGRRDRYHRIGLLIPLTVGAVAIPLQIVMGDVIARYVFHAEPAKFAAIEALPHTRTHAPETLGGVLVDGKVRFGIPIPSTARRCCRASARAPRCRGSTRSRPRCARPTSWSSIVHLSFDVMVGTGFALARARAVVRPGLVAVAGRRARTGGSCAPWRSAGSSRSCRSSRGWIVTEVGRQPWTVVGLLLTRDAVQTSGNLWPLVRRRRGHLRRRHRRRGLRPARAAAPVGRRRGHADARTDPRTSPAAIGWSAS